MSFKYERQGLCLCYKVQGNIDKTSINRASLAWYVVMKAVFWTKTENKYLLNIRNIILKCSPVRDLILVKNGLSPMFYCAVRYSISNDFLRRFELKIYVLGVFRQTLSSLGTISFQNGCKVQLNHKLVFACHCYMLCTLIKWLKVWVK